MNEKTLTITHESVTYNAFTLDALRERGVPEAVITSAMTAELAQTIDDAASDVYAKANRYSDEYKAREAAAIAYKTAEYKGDVSTFVSSFAQSAGLTNKDATDTILAQATAFRGALEMLGGLRMQKFAIKAMTDIEVAQATTDGIVAQIRAIGAQL